MKQPLRSLFLIPVILGFVATANAQNKNKAYFEIIQRLKGLSLSEYLTNNPGGVDYRCHDKKDVDVESIFNLFKELQIDLSDWATRDLVFVSKDDDKTLIMDLKNSNGEQPSYGGTVLSAPDLAIGISETLNDVGVPVAILKIVTTLSKAPDVEKPFSIQVCDINVD